MCEFLRGKKLNLLQIFGQNQGGKIISASIISNLQYKAQKILQRMNKLKALVKIALRCGLLLSMEEYLIQNMNQERRRELKEIILGTKNLCYQQDQVEEKVKASQKLNQNDLESNCPLFSLGFFAFRSTQQREKTLRVLQKSLHYAVKRLKPPPIELLNHRSVKFPESTNKKLLLLDLDETLIHTFYGSKKADIHFSVDEFEYNFNLRPLCLHFLNKMSQIYDIYIFTAATKEYAKPIIEYINNEVNVIKGFLHRDHCLKTKNGFYIKDLRIITGSRLEDMVIVDNHLRSFSFQIDNGIPIQGFEGSRQDKILVKLAKFLKKVAQQENIPKFLSKTLRIKDLISISKQKNQHSSYDGQL